MPPADSFKSVALAAAHNRILLWRASDEKTERKQNNPSPAIPEFYLLDAAAGKTELVKGQFQPLIQQTFRSLQSTGKSFEYWAALYDKAKNKTEIGRYDARGFSFASVLSIPEIELGSMDIWADEKEAKIYFISWVRNGLQI